MLGQDVIPAVVLLIALAFSLSILLFQVFTGVPPHSSNAIEAADVVALMRQAGLAENRSAKKEES